MAAARADTTPPVLRLVRDGEGVPAPEPTTTHLQLVSEGFSFARKGTARVEMKTARQFVIPRAVPFLVERAPSPPRSRRAPGAAVPARRAARQQDIIERHHHLQVYGSRPRSIGRRKLSKVERRELLELTLSLAKGKHYVHRPRTWGVCKERLNGPCPWVSCKHHNYLEVDPVTGVIKINFPGMSPLDIPETCSLRAAEEGEHTLEATGVLLNLTLERTRQVEEGALAKGKAEARRRRLGPGDDAD